MYSRQLCAVIFIWYKLSDGCVSNINFDLSSVDQLSAALARRPSKIAGSAQELSTVAAWSWQRSAALTFVVKLIVYHYRMKPFCHFAFIVVVFIYFLLIFASSSSALLIPFFWNQFSSPPLTPLFLFL